MNSKFIFGQYYPTNSWFHRLDPRTKLLGLFILMVAVVLVRNLYILGGFVLFLSIVIFTTKISFWRFLKSMKALLVLLLFTVSMQLLLNKEGKLLTNPPLAFTLDVLNLCLAIGFALFFISTLFFLKKGKLLIFLVLLIGSFLLQHYVHLGPVIADYEIAIYSGAVQMGGLIILRMVSLLFLSTLLTLTTTPTDLNKGLEKLLRLPTISMMLSLAMRYIPTLINESQKILKAQASRGVDFKEGGLKAKTTQIISLLIPMFVIAYKRSEDLAYAMQARGFIPKARRTSINELKMRWFDYVVLGICLVLFAGALAALILRV